MERNKVERNIVEKQIASKNCLGLCPSRAPQWAVGFVLWPLALEDNHAQRKPRRKRSTGWQSGSTPPSSLKVRCFARTGGVSRVVR
jgi:hypothetical protein